MRVGSFLKFVAEARGVSKQQLRRSIDRVIEQLQLSQVQSRQISDLSKGFKRRVGLAQALIHDPRVLILDEPTDGLDPNQKHEVRQLINHLSSDKIVIISTHILEEVEAVCQRAMIINCGRLVADELPSQLKAQSDYHHAIELVVDNGESLLSELSKLPGAKRAFIENEGEQRLIVLVERDADLLEPVMTFLQQRQITPKTLAVSPGRLDDVFRQITSDSASGSYAGVKS